MYKENINAFKVMWDNIKKGIKETDLEGVGRFHPEGGVGTSGRLNIHGNEQYFLVNVPTKSTYDKRYYTLLPRVSA